MVPIMAEVSEVEVGEEQRELDPITFPTLVKPPFLVGRHMLTPG